MDQRTAVARIVHGSRLFGTDTKDSDTDYKTVVIPSAREIVLGETDWSSRDAEPDKPGEDDEESHDLLRFVRLLQIGQPVAMELLFAPRRFHTVDPHPAWEELERNRERIVTREMSKFAGYCRRMAILYDSKPERILAAERLVEVLNRLIVEYGADARLADHVETVVAAVKSPHVDVENGPRHLVPHLRVCERLTPLTAPLKVSAEMAAKIARNYKRRLARPAPDAVRDRKSVAHALRIGNEALELLTTGHMTLPRPEAPRLRAIRGGEVPIDEAVAEVAEVLARIEAETERSALPESPDVGFLESVVMDTYCAKVSERASCSSPTP